MMFNETDHDLTIELKTHGFELPTEEYAKIEESLGSLRDAVDCFPVKSLNITVICHQRQEDYHVKMSLILPGRTLFTGERDRLVYPAIERCTEKLLRKVVAFKNQLEAEEERSKHASGTYHTVNTSMDFDTQQLEESRMYDDYLRFRLGLDGFTSALSEKIGRWVQRYPEIEELLGEGVTISDIVEGVFYHAYEQFSQRSPEVPPGAWLESLIDPTIQDLLRAPEEEFANISYAKHRLDQHPR